MDIIKNITIHTSRTIMFAELAKVMDYALQNHNFIESLNQNVFHKKTKSGIDKTSKYLSTLYGFDNNSPAFKALKHFWNVSEENEKPLLAIIYAINRDYLLAESIDCITHTKLGEKVTIESLEQNIEKLHANKYSAATKKSLAQNIASSWKQVGFIAGKVKNIRVQPVISSKVVGFAMLLAYLNGERGDFIFSNMGVKALCLNESKLRELAIEAAKRDLMQYQYGGNVTAISFNNIIKTLGIDAV